MPRATRHVQHDGLGPRGLVDEAADGWDLAMLSVLEAHLVALRVAPAPTTLEVDGAAGALIPLAPARMKPRSSCATAASTAGLSSTAKAAGRRWGCQGDAGLWL